MKSLADQLRPYLTMNQTSALALQWLAHFSKSTDGFNKHDVQQKLELLIEDNVEGLRFFFQELEFATTLLDLLEVPRDERMALFHLADKLIAAGGQQRPQAIIDATKWSAVASAPDVFQDLIKRRFMTHVVLRPVVLLLTRDQKTLLGQRLEDLEPVLRLEVVQDHAEGWADYVECSGEDVLIISSRQFKQIERWMAARFHKNQLFMEPSGGLEAFATDGKLPSLPEVAHSLAELWGERSTPQVKLPSNPVELRRLMFTLRTEAGAIKLKLGPEVRLACAKILGLDVSSTGKERLEHKLGNIKRKLNIQVKDATETILNTLLLEGKERFIPPTALVVDGMLHMINPTADQKRLLPDDAIIHEIDTTPPAVTRLIEAIDHWTEDDFALDPGLLHAIDRLDKSGQERLAFLHSRACLIWSQGLELNHGKPHEDWQGALEKLLSGDPPPSELRLSGYHNKDKYKGWSQPIMFVAVVLDPLQNCPPEVAGVFKKMSEDGQRLLSMLPALHGFSANRQDELMVNSYHRRWYGEFDGGLFYRDPPPPSILIPKDPAQARNPAIWNELYHGSQAFHPAREPGWQAPKGHKFELLKGLEYWQSMPFEIPKKTWKAADLELALAWIALREATNHSHATRLHDGTILLPLGSGIFAEVYLWESGMADGGTNSPGEVRASLSAVCEMAFSGKPEAQLLELRSPVTTHMATTETSIGKVQTALGYSLPNTIHLTGHGVHANISFLASPFFMGSGQQGGHVAAVAGAIEAVQDQARIQKAERLDVVTFEDEDV